MRILDKKVGRKIPVLAGWLLRGLSSFWSGDEGGDDGEDSLFEVGDGLVSLGVSGTVGKGLRLDSEGWEVAASVGSALDEDEVKECTEGREEAEIPVGPEVGEEGGGVAEAEVVPGEEGAIEEDERDVMSPGDIFEEAEASFVEEGMATRAYRKVKEGQE